jgi:magnesium-protoporphyrin IX monomethyl ester (oxidative) cyclase
MSRLGKSILLVRVPEIEFQAASDDLRSRSVAGLTIPLGVTYLAAYIRHYSDYEAQILDLYAEDFLKYTSRMEDSDVLNLATGKLLDAISLLKPEVIGFSALFLYQYNLVKELARAVRDTNSEIKIILGGFSTVAAEVALHDIPALDMVFVGEAEKPLLKVIEGGFDGRSFEGINGIGYRKGNQIQINRTPDLVTDLSEIPFPAFDLLPLESYKEILGRNEFPFLTSRGCPFNCNFCSSKLYAGNALRRRSHDDLMSEIKKLRDIYEIDFLWIRDDNFNCNKEHAKTFIRNLIEHNLTVPWCDSNALNVNSTDEELLDLCKASQCTEVIFAVESGSPRVLKEIMNKRVDLSHAMKMAEYCKRINLPFECYFVIGNPGETKEEIQQTIDFARLLQPDHCVFSIATPFPGTRYYETALERGYLKDDYQSITGMKYMQATMATEDFSTEWLKDTQYDANIKLNFLESRLVFSQEKTSLEQGLKKYGDTFQQYRFHAIARLLEGYFYLELGNTNQGHRIFREVQEMLKEGEIAKAYSKYFQWDTPATNAYRQWSQRRGENT